MKQKILEKAGDMFLNLGFKSVTMDDIASEIGVSKKTIYAHFENKTALVHEATLMFFDSVCDGINLIHEQEKNPIIELFEVKKFVMDFLKNEKSSPQYQLQKYYPEIFTELKFKHFDFMHNCIHETLDRGLEQGLFRETINKEFVSRIYFSGMMAIKDEDLFPKEAFLQSALMDEYLEYHLRAICTEKGIKIIEKQLKN